MKNTIIEPFKKWWHFILTNLGVGLIIALFTTNDYSAIYLLYGTLWSTSISLSQWLGHAWLQTRIARRYSWMTHPKQRLILTFVSVTLYSIFAWAVVQSMMHLIVYGSIPRYLYTINGYWIAPVLISLFISTIIGSIGFFVSWQKSVLEKEQLKAEMLNYKYEALKNQINPHFMFNSLNVLSELVFDDQKLAVKFIQQFSDIYRYVLDKRNEELVSIREELDLIRKYVFLLQTRFENKLVVNIELPNKDNEVIIPLALQLLIENAVKHNEVSTQNPLEIDICRNNNYICVKNTKRAKNTGENSNKVGLKNLEQQYRFFTDEPVHIVNHNGTFQVNIPILNAT